MKNTLFFFCLFFVTICQGQDPVAAYTFHNGTYLDFSGSGNDLTPVGNLSASDDINGNTNNAILINGGHLRSDNEDLHMDGPITVSVWIRIDEVNDWTAIVNRWIDAEGGYYLGINPGNQTVRWNCFVDAIEDTQILPLDEWIHFAASYDGNDMKLYRNGNLVNSVSTTTIFGINDVPFMIGAQSGSPDDNFRGDVDDVVVYKSALTDIEVLAIYETGFQLRNKDLALASLEQIERVQVAPTPLLVKSSVYNLGMEPINSFDIIWSDGTSEEMASYTGLNIETGLSLEIEEPANLTLEIGQQIFLDVRIENVNGSLDDSQLNDSHSTNIRGFSFIPQRKMVIEEGTGTWCGWCPRGAVALDQLTENYPDEFIGIAVHNNDPMVVEEYDSNIGFVGFPECHVDRTLNNVGIGPISAESYYQERVKNIDNTAQASVSHTTSLSNGANLLQVDIEATIAYPLEGDFRFMVVLTEDGVTGTSSGYDQSNTYSGGGVGPMGGYELLPNPVPAADMVYDHVAIGIYGGVDGQPGSLPSIMEAGETYSYSFTIDSLNFDDPSNVHVITMMLDGTSGSVINATSSRLLDGVVATEEIDLDQEIKLYPNPSNGTSFLKIHLNQKSNVSLQIFDVSGKRVMSQNYIDQVGEKIYPIVTRADMNGLYFIQVQFNDKVITKKWLLK